MKRIKTVGGTVAVILLLFGAFMTGKHAGAASKTPGSTEDPLITLSYLESRLAGRGGNYEAVLLKKGETLYGDIGTGIVLLTGSATATGDGVVDLTEGYVTREETSIFLYHNYMVHSENGGCTALTGCTVLVQGEYLVQ